MMSEKRQASTVHSGMDANRGSEVIACAVVFIFFCTVFVGLRFLSYRLVNRKIFFEDWLIIPAYVLMMGICAAVICSMFARPQPILSTVSHLLTLWLKGVKLGDVGRHLEWVLANEPDAMVRWAQCLFVMQCLFGTQIAMTKTSILLLYHRIFQIHKWFRYLMYALIAYIWIWALCVLFLAVFQCHPVALQWDQSLEGTCIDRVAYYRAIGPPNTVHDVVMVVVPAVMIWKTQTSKHQKIALSTIFLLASL